MKITYDRKFKKIIINGENNLIIPYKGTACISADAENIKQFNEDTGVIFHIENFVYKGFNNMSFKEKLRLIFEIIKA